MRICAHERTSKIWVWNPISLRLWLGDFFHQKQKKKSCKELKNVFGKVKCKIWEMSRLNLFASSSSTFALTRKKVMKFFRWGSHGVWRFLREKISSKSHFTLHTFRRVSCESLKGRIYFEVWIHLWDSIAFASEFVRIYAAKSFARHLCGNVEKELVSWWNLIFDPNCESNRSPLFHAPPGFCLGAISSTIENSIWASKSTLVEYLWTLHIIFDCEPRWTDVSICQNVNFGLLRIFDSPWTWLTRKAVCIEYWQIIQYLRNFQITLETSPLHLNV